MTDEVLVAVLQEAADAVASALAKGSRQLVEGSAAQHHSDLRTDAAACEVLRGHGLAVLSEESGHRAAGHRRADGTGLVVVVDPLDGSTNAACGIPWYAVSLCVVDADGPRVAVVRNLATEDEYCAVRGSGATRGGRLFTSPPDRTETLSEALVLLSGHSHSHLGWRQYRALGALALDLCAVATGDVDAYLDCSVDAHGVWDYLGGALVAAEAGVVVADVRGRRLDVLEHGARRTPVAGPPALVAALARAWPLAAGVEP